MAQPVSFHTPPRDRRELLRARVEHAPEDHAEAILAAYDVLQQLHDRGLLDILRAGLAAGDDLLDMAVDSVDEPATIRAVRNLLFWQRVLGLVDPEALQGMVKAIPDGLATAAADSQQPVSVWRVLRRAFSKDSLRGLTATVDLLESFGRHLHVLESSAPDRPSNT